MTENVVRNRWFHAPELHSPKPGTEKKVTWLELFYDLIYVATIIQLGNALSNNVSLEGFVVFAALFVPLWLAWTGFTFYENRFHIDDFTHRATIFVQMFAIGIMAVCVEDVIAGRPTGFALAYGTARMINALLYLRSWIQVKQAREFSSRWALIFAADATLWLLSVFVPAPLNYVMWGLGIVISLSIPVSRSTRELSSRFPPDILHMSERYGLLTIIVLGESFVKILSHVADTLHGKGDNALLDSGEAIVQFAAATADKHVAMGPELLLMGGLCLAITFSLWWIYFDDVAGSRIKAQPLAPIIWIYSHLPMMIGVTAVGVAIKKFVFLDPWHWHGGEDKYRWLLCGSLALALLWVGIIDSVTERRQAELSDRARVNARIGSAAFVLLIAPVGGYLPPWLFVALISGITIAQVIFDLLMAPEEADPHMAHHDAQAIFGAAAVDHNDADDNKPRRRWDITQAVRKGTPSEMRRDLYFYLMEAPWSRVLLFFMFIFLFLNVVFAALYMLQPGSFSVPAGGEGNFANAFFFSVQTMSTIGYGSLIPLTDYGNILVTVQAAVGMLFVALSTGVFFTKASRPSGSVLFSKPVVITTRDGVKTLVFRLGNGRGNEIIEANINVAVLMDTVSAEGHKLRALVDLDLRRKMTPVFSLTWSVMHVIDDSSPLKDVDWSQDESGIVALLATMTGFDSTYAQTIHARKTWYPENIFDNHRFVDVIHNLPDGRLLVDYTQFHSIVADDAATQTQLDGKENE